VRKNKRGETHNIWKQLNTARKEMNLGLIQTFMGLLQGPRLPNPVRWHRKPVKFCLHQGCNKQCDRNYVFCSVEHKKLWEAEHPNKGKIPAVINKRGRSWLQSHKGKNGQIMYHLLPDWGWIR